MSSLILEDVYVHFPIFGSQPSLRKALYNRSIGGLIGKEARRKNRVVVKALEGISLDLKDGDRLGLVGHNGAGKSTLLRVMAGIYEPISGIVRASGRITPLLEILPALDGEDTGYDNIISSGLMLGMSNAQVQDCISDIEEFTELGEYLTLPVRTYSAGMLTRLGFALATAIEPDILLIDEGIGAGDQRFAQKAERRLNELVGRSRILVLSSHSDGLIHQFCNKVALLQEGKIIALGPPDEVIAQYHATAAGALGYISNEPLGVRDEGPTASELTDPSPDIENEPSSVGDEGPTASELTDPSPDIENEPSSAGDEEPTASELTDPSPDIENEPSSAGDEEPTASELIAPSPDIGQPSLPFSDPTEPLQTPTLEDAIEGALLQLTNLYYARASKYATEKSFPLALVDLRKSLDFDSHNILALLTIGQIQATAGELDEASEAFRRVLRIIPDHAGATTGLTSVGYLQAEKLNEAGMHLDALSTLEECRELSPSNIYVLLLSAEIQVQLGDEDAAAEYYKCVLEIDKSNEDAERGLESLAPV